MIAHIRRPNQRLFRRNSVGFVRTNKFTSIETLCGAEVTDRDFSSKKKRSESDTISFLEEFNGCKKCLEIEGNF